MTVLKCDRCRKEINIASRFICRRRIRILDEDDRGKPTDELTNVERKYDLCEKCSTEIEEMIHAGGRKADA